MKKIICFGGSSTLVSQLLPTILDNFENVVLVYRSNINLVKSHQAEYGEEQVQIISDIDLFNSTEESNNIIADYDALLFSQCSNVSLKPVLKKDEKDFLTLFENQVIYPHKALKLLLPKLSKQKRGLIVSVLSKGIEGESPGLMSDYITAKGATKSYFESVRSEYKKKNIKVEFLYPEFFPSTLTQGWPKVGPYSSDGLESFVDCKLKFIEICNNYKETV